MLPRMTTRDHLGASGVDDRAAADPGADRIADAGEAIAVAQAIAASFAPGAVDRDRSGALPRDEIARFDASGLLSLTVPAAYGGPDVPWRTVAEVIRLLAAADPSLAQVPQGHLLQLDAARLLGGEALRERVFAAALSGRRVASALAERGGAHAQDLGTRLLRRDGLLLLRGRKHYCTGAATAELIAVSARTEAGRLVVAVVPREAPGVHPDLEWHAMGQRATVSGSLALDDVPVAPVMVLPWGEAFAGPQLLGARAQLVHAAIEVGIACGALDDGVDVVRTTARPFFEAAVAGWAPTAARDPQTTRRAGRLATRVEAARALLDHAAAVIDEIGPIPADEEEAARGSLAVAKAKAFGSEVALEVASEIFAMGGAGSTDLRLGLDRHWRNARTHSVHDPADWKYHHVGAHLLSGTLPPNHSQI
jgi:SfnB family sulfur acquisition oxidoreductase